MTQTTLSDDRKWRRNLQVGAAFLFGAICTYGAIRASFFFITDYANQTGWPTSHAYLLPLSLDALGATGFLIYGITRDKFAGWVGVGAIAVSMLFNAASHWFTTGLLDPSWGWITSGAFIPALSAGLIVHMVSRWLNPKEADETPTSTDSAAAGVSVLGASGDNGTGPDAGPNGRAAEDPTPKRRPVRKAGAKAATRTRRPNAPDVDTIADLVRARGYTTQRQVMDELGAGSGKATHEVVVAALAANSNGH